jgi:mannose-1-phosphate guanylyltransferase
MVTETVDRFGGLIPLEQVAVVTSESLADAIADAIPGLPADNILREPIGRNTAPCIGLAAVWLREKLGRTDEVMAVFPADHFIRDVERFRDVVRLAALEAESGAIVTLGIEPTKPETGYGYIRRGPISGQGVADVQRFVEKPNRETAMRYLADGDYLWNAGIFFFRIDTILREIQRQLPRLSAQLEQLATVFREGGDGARIAEIFDEIESISIDYGVMEGAEQVRVIPASFGWSDVGAWDALPEVAETDPSGNVTMGDVVAFDCRDSILMGHDKRVLAAVGLDRIVVVDSEDALLVAPRERVQEVRAIVESLRNRDGRLT